jgi:hypothetical protein
MRPLRALIRSAVFSFVLLALTAGPSFAQLTPSPKASPGLCAPWHKCLAQGFMLLVVLYVLMMGAMYMWQRRGFDKLEHKQGNPEGVPAKRE